MLKCYKDVMSTHITYYNGINQVLYLEHLRSHEIIVGDQRNDVVRENHCDLAEQHSYVHCPGDAVQVNRILGFAFHQISCLLTAFIFVFSVTVEESMVEQQCQHYVEHQEQYVWISGVPRVLEHNHDVIVQTEELQYLQDKQHPSVQNEYRSHFIHRRNGRRNYDCTATTPTKTGSCIGIDNRRYSCDFLVMSNMVLQLNIVN